VLSRSTFRENDTFACNVGQQRLIVEHLEQYGPDVVLPHADTLKDAARRVWRSVSITGKAGIATVDDDTLPELVAVPDGKICPRPRMRRAEAGVMVEL
jgi:hypothetical protein